MFFRWQSALQVHDLETGKLLRKFPLEIGQIVAFSGDKKYSEIFYQFMSFLTPGKNTFYSRIQTEINLKSIPFTKAPSTGSIFRHRTSNRPLYVT